MENRERRENEGSPCQGGTPSRGGNQERDYDQYGGIGRSPAQKQSGRPSPSGVPNEGRVMDSHSDGKGEGGRRAHGGYE